MTKRRRASTETEPKPDTMPGAGSSSTDKLKKSLEKSGTGVEHGSTQPEARDIDEALIMRLKAYGMGGENEDYETLVTREIEKIVERLNSGISEERKAMDKLLSRLRTTRIAA